MTTLAVMKARIATELRRSDLTAQIAEAITTAIKAYEHERFYWNESRENTFSTVADQQNYSSSDAAFIGNITKIDYVYLLVGDTSHKLIATTLDEMENVISAATSAGQPSEYAWYNEQLWLYPTPPEVWTVRVGAVLDIAEPATDGELNNPWMVKAERLIRSRAKNELFLHVLRDFEMAQAMALAVDEAERQLFVRTTRQTKTGGGRVKAMDF